MTNITITEGIVDGEWRKDAACRDMDTNIFFDDVSDTHEAKSNNFFKREYAKSICAKCPVSNECLEYAISNNVIDGVYGGLTYRKRLAYKKKIGRLNERKSHSKLK